MICVFPSFEHSAGCVRNLQTILGFSCVPSGTRESAHCLRVVGHILRIVKAWQETQNLMHSAAWKKYSNFASKIYRRLLHFGTSLLQVPYNQIPTSVSALSLSVLLSQCDRERLLFILSVGRSLDGDIHGRSCFVILKF